MPVRKGDTGTREKRTEPVTYSYLDSWRELLVRSLRSQAAGAEREVTEIMAVAERETQQAMVGCAGTELLSLNLSEVQELFLRAGLGKLCDGKFRSADDPLVKNCCQDASES